MLLAPILCKCVWIQAQPTNLDVFEIHSQILYLSTFNHLFHMPGFLITNYERMNRNISGSPYLGIWSIHSSREWAVNRSKAKTDDWTKNDVRLERVVLVGKLVPINKSIPSWYWPAYTCDRLLRPPGMRTQWYMVLQRRRWCARTGRRRTVSSRPPCAWM